MRLYVTQYDDLPGFCFLCNGTDTLSFLIESCHLPHNMQAMLSMIAMLQEEPTRYRFQ